MFSLENMSRLVYCNRTTYMLTGKKVEKGVQGLPSFQYV